MPLRILIAFLTVFFLIGVSNFFIQKKIDNVKEPEVMAFKPKPDDSQNKQEQVSFKEVIRKMRLDPNRVYFESIFFAEDKEIARYKSIGDKIYDITSRIPDGRVSFVNETQNTYGEEYYLNEKKYGPYREYYSTGQIKREAEYEQGKAIVNREYFIDGTLRMEQDFRDALWGIDQEEVGEGKVYYRNGMLMYEWHLTNALQGGYNKSYNIEGDLIEFNHFDRNGEIVKTEHFGVYKERELRK